MNDWNITREPTLRWVWPKERRNEINQVVDFVHDFTVSTRDEPAALRLSTDTDYAVWLNSTLIGRGQYPDYPGTKTYDLFWLTEHLRTGTNRLAFMVYYNGQSSSTYRRGEAGLLYSLTGADSAVESGSATWMRLNPCYHSGAIARVSCQLSFTFGYDARPEDNFQNPVTRLTSTWRQAEGEDLSLSDDRLILLPRPVARMEESGATSSRLVSQGLFRRCRSSIEERLLEATGEEESAGLSRAKGGHVSPAWLMQHDLLSYRHPRELFENPLSEVTQGTEPLILAPEKMKHHDGAYLIFDLGREEAGLLELEVEAASGCLLDIAYGEHLDDLRVRSFVGERHFAARVICRQGRQHFHHHFLRWAGRYLQIHVQSQGERFILHHLRLRRLQHPIPERGEISIPHSQKEMITRVCRRTLTLCMHEHYEDTPWREQALYANDARIQALGGYYVFGEPRFPASSLSLLGRGLRTDGFLELTAPAEVPVTIPSFTLVWILAVRDHLLFTGDRSLAETFLPQIISMLDRFLAERRDHLLPLRQETGIWHFYDWTEGLSGYPQAAFDKGLTVDCPLNCFLILALEAAVELGGWLLQPEKELSRFTEATRELRVHTRRLFRDTESGLYRTHAYEPVLSQLPQALAVLAGVAIKAEAEHVLSVLSAQESILSRTGLSQSFYKYEALMNGRKTFALAALNEIERDWGAMLAQGATSFWETNTGASDFDLAGSLCHGWSSTPLFIYYQQLLGIHPLEPGFRRFAINPVTTALPFCEGSVPTPFGQIHLRWERQEGKTLYRLRGPEQCLPVLLDSKGEWMP